MRDTRYDEVYLYFQEEGHKYTDSLGNKYFSVTTLIHENYVPNLIVNIGFIKKLEN